ncbi:MAG: T9SS type A sorting domain-containing protein [Bacteroidales bacterium]|nr:T9SS type A sorting domain-containing protein [Bacteroidales bacterium]
MKRFLSFLIFNIVLVAFANAQIETIRMMHYNLLYYEEQAIGCSQTNNNLNTKDSSLKTIISYVNPDVLVVNEVGSNITYVDRIVNNVLNTEGRNYFQHCPLTNYSGGNIANMLFYNSDKLAFHSHFYIVTVNRDINGYKMYYKTPNLVNGDTIFTTFLLAHLKAGTGSDNEQKRYSQVVNLMSKLENIGVYDNYCLSGDFNLYGASEQAYQYLIHYENSLYRFYDPLDDEAEWHENYNYRSIHTQSTHTDNNGCAASGGLDDRFDFILISPSVNYGSRRVAYIPNTYHALGNDGNHYNKSINSPANNAVPSNVADALYKMSDHLPVVMDLAVDITPSSIPTVEDFSINIVNPIENNLIVSLQSSVYKQLMLEIYTMEGQLIGKHLSDIAEAGQRIEVPFPYPAGFYIMKISDGTRVLAVKKMIKK